MNGNHFLSGSLSRSVRVTIHWILQALAGILITSAFTLVFINKNRFGYPHFKSTHSLFGLSTVIITYITIFGGIVTRLSFDLRKTIPPIIFKTIHSFFGLIVYVLAMITISFGIYSYLVSTTAMQGSLIGILVVTALYVLYESIFTFVKRAKTILAKE